jgi:hypothetical protein
MNLSGLMSGMDGLGKGGWGDPSALDHIVPLVTAIGGQVAQNLDISQRPELTRILTQSQVNTLNAQGWNQQNLQQVLNQGQLDMFKAQGAVSANAVSTAPAGAGGGGSGGGAHGGFGGSDIWSNPWTWAAIGGAVLLIGGGVAYKRSRS